MNEDEPKVTLEFTHEELVGLIVANCGWMHKCGRSREGYESFLAAHELQRRLLDAAGEIRKKIEEQPHD